ncbi:unnamed protein product [Acanthoscelides obtectus]|uniref:G-protein coupled receptors family 2 profile 2 domain-containing protein n=1 Tax=Acanthoscelides obtectus TaxID=200917 RepID=A0A9P0PXE9_ACAOB|nr:unnamed protein product [Acanthoscelides obtectus]CAK1675463.1 G-protein coupled receptor Mth2 [Acanthoscelides obtectus]
MPSFLVAVLLFIVVVSEETVDLCAKNSTDYATYSTNDQSQCNCSGLCVRKCCQYGFYHVHIEYDSEFSYSPTTVNLRILCIGASESFCKKSETLFNFSVPIFNVTQYRYNMTDFSVGLLTCNENSYVRYFKLNNSDPTERYYVQNNGSLYYHRSRRFYAPDRFCVDEEDGLSVYLCYSHVPQRPALPVQAGMIISMPFLLLTFLVYLIIPEKNLHRKALMFYVICLLLAYVLLVTSNLSKYSFPDVTCHLIGYFIMFFFLGSFLWMNVMCIDMWLTFSGARGYGGTRSTEQKRFLFYCLYAVGVPAMFILFVFLLNTYGDEESIFHPKLGRNKCFLEDGYPQLFYLYLPMATLIGMNIILFILTAIKIQRVKMETAMLKQTDSRKHNYEGDKQQFNLYLKLLFAMGVNWTTEVISWAALWKMQSVPSWIWYLTDLINALYGIFIFFIFVFKKKIWQSLKKRLLWKSSNCTLSSGVSTPHVSDIKLT